MKNAALTILAIFYLAAAASPWLAPHAYEQQFRDAAAQAPTGRFPLGTDELGRDRWSRLLAGSRISLLLAPAAAFLAVLLAAAAAGGAEIAGGGARKCILASADLSLAVPSFFLLLLARACLPLNTRPEVSVLITFLLLGVLGWAAPARVVAGAARQVLDGAFVTAARARGVPAWRLWAAHLLPAMRPVLSAQFFTLIPVFLLAEANLGMLGLGVTEPLPSWGGLLRELEPVAAAGGNFLAQPWLLAPAVSLVLAVAACSVLATQGREP